MVFVKRRNQENFLKVPPTSKQEEASDLEFVLYAGFHIPIVILTPPLSFLLYSEAEKLCYYLNPFFGLLDPWAPPKT